MTDCIGETLIADDDFVKAFLIKRLPRQIQQIKISKKRIQRLALTQAAYIVKARVEQGVSTSERLQTTTHHTVLLKYSNLHAVLGQHKGALQAA